MQAYWYESPGTFGWRETPAPTLEQTTDALVRPLAVAACDLDRLIAQSGSPFPGPYPLGHEFCGEVVEIGPDVKALAVGQQVVASFQPSCGTCPRCRQGHSSVCETVPMTSMYGIGQAGGDWSGALADLIRVPWADYNLRLIPTAIDPVAIASGSDNLLDGLRAVDAPLQTRPRSSVLVAGRGSIPLYAVACARFLGASQVSFASQDRCALDVAQTLGADCLEVDTWPRKFNSHEITFDCTNEPEGLAAVVRSTAPHGFSTSASIYFQGEPAMPLLDMYMKGITFCTGRVNSAAQLGRMLELVGSGFDPGVIQPQVQDFSDVSREVFTDVPFSRKLIFVRT